MLSSSWSRGAEREVGTRGREVREVSSSQIVGVPSGRLEQLGFIPSEYFRVCVCVYRQDPSLKIKILSRNPRCKNPKGGQGRSEVGGTALGLRTESDASSHLASGGRRGTSCREVHRGDGGHSKGPRAAGQGGPSCVGRKRHSSGARRQVPGCAACSRAFSGDPPPRRPACSVLPPR